MIIVELAEATVFNWSVVIILESRGHVANDVQSEEVLLIISIPLGPSGDKSSESFGGHVNTASDLDHLVVERVESAQDVFVRHDLAGGIAVDA